MPPLEVRVPHSLGREEIKRRIDVAIMRARDEYEPQVGPIKADWVETHRLAVGLSVMGMPFDGQVDVHDTEVLVRVELPGMVSMFAGRIRDGIEERLGGLLVAPTA